MVGALRHGLVLEVVAGNKAGQVRLPEFLIAEMNNQLSPLPALLYIKKAPLPCLYQHPHQYS